MIKRITIILLFLVQSIFVSNALSNNKQHNLVSEPPPPPAKKGYKGFSVTRFSIFTGTDYQLGPQHRKTLRVDHADGWLLGDNFFFVDIANFDQPGTGLYSEWHPRLSFSKMSGHKIGYGFITDVLFASQLNLGNNFRAYLGGIGFNVKVPGFKFVKANFYVRNNPALAGHTYQTTIAWGAPFTIPHTNLDMIFAGYIDYAGREGRSSSFILANPRIMADLGKYLWHAKLFYAGFRFTYWHNKLGVRGMHESLPELMVTLRV